MDHFFPQLPALQERLVEAFKSFSNDLHTEVWICILSDVFLKAFMFLRVLITKMSAKRMSNFWPLILSEMVYFVIRS